MNLAEKILNSQRLTDNEVEFLEYTDPESLPEDIDYYTGYDTTTEKVEIFLVKEKFFRLTYGGTTSNSQIAMEVFPVKVVEEKYLTRKEIIALSWQRIKNTL